MSVIPVDLSAKRPKRAPKRHGFWRGLAQKLDSLAAYPTKHALSDSELRHVADDIERCRQLIPGRPLRRVDARLDRRSLQPTVRTIKARP